MSYLIYKNLADLNGLDRAEAVRIFLDCCGSHRWAELMADERPFRTVEHFFFEAEEKWFSLATVDHLDAFAVNTVVRDLVERAGGHETDQLRELCDLYKQKFGFIFVVNARGKPIEEIRAIAVARLRNSAETELKLASEEQHKIIQTKLAELLER